MVVVGVARNLVAGRVLKGGRSIVRLMVEAGGANFLGVQRVLKGAQTTA
jgi:hypothetical protein